MIEPRLFLCSGATARDDDAIREGRRIIELDSIGSQANVNIRFENVAKVLQHHLSPRLMDLLEIAAYVYTADCSTQRGSQWTDEDSTEPWGRDFSFVIPVRDPEFWDSVSNQLTELLHFLSDDRYSFQFVPLTQERFGKQEYLEFGDTVAAVANVLTEGLRLLPLAFRHKTPKPTMRLMSLPGRARTALKRAWLLTIPAMRWS